MGQAMTRKPETIAFWHGRLPHWEVAEGRYFVTIHLAGAIPRQGQERIRRLAADHAKAQPSDLERWLQVQRRIYAEEYASHLGGPAVAQMVLEAIRHRH